MIQLYIYIHTHSFSYIPLHYGFLQDIEYGSLCSQGSTVDQLLTAAGGLSCPLFEAVTEDLPAPPICRDELPGALSSGEAMWQDPGTAPSFQGPHRPSPQRPPSLKFARCADTGPAPGAGAPLAPNAHSHLPGGDHLTGLTLETQNIDGWFGVTS